MSAYRRLTLLAALLLAAAVAPAAFAQGGPPAMPVSVSAPIAKRVTQWDEYSGRFEAVATVDIRARVSGFIETLHFKDGQDVHIRQIVKYQDYKQFVGRSTIRYGDAVDDKTAPPAPTKK